MKKRFYFPKDKYLKYNKLNNISEWKRHEGEWVGTREKFIISPPNSDYPQYMVKFPKYGPNETNIELFNCFLGFNLNLRIASYFPCTYKEKYGVVTKSFLKNKSELWEMKELICHYSNLPNLEEKMGRDTDVLKEHDIDNIFLILKNEFGDGDKVLNDFFRMIGFDCLIGHGDRHWTNYGVILEEKNQKESLNYKFAPIYDTASGYLLEMTDEKLKEMIKTDKLNDENWYRPKKKALCKIVCKQDIKTNHIELFEYIIGQS